MPTFGPALTMIAKAPEANWETAMTPQERQLIDDLFDRLGKLESAPRDPDAVAAIAQGLRRAPNAVYALVQTVLLQDEALKRANAHIEELESAGAPGQSQSGGFLDSMRGALFGQNQNQPHGSVPNVRPPEAPNRPVWNSGQVMGQGMPQSGPYNQPSYGQPSYGQPYGAPQAPMGGGGSFLGTAAAAAAGVVGGSLLLGSIRNMMGGSHQGFGDAASLGGVSKGPWSSDQSDSNLARDAGINDIGSGSRADSSGAGLFDQASNDEPDHDDMDLDSDDFGGGDDGSGSDYA
jgi:hypothetical protein